MAPFLMTLIDLDLT